MADETQTTDSEPLLSLSTLAPRRPTIAIDEKLYELRLLDHDFSADAHARLETDLGEFDELRSKKKRSKGEAQRLSMLLDRLFDQVMIDVPEAVKASLSDEQKRTVVVTFHYAPVLAQALAQQKTEQEAEETVPTTAT